MEALSVGRERAPHPETALPSWSLLGWQGRARSAYVLLLCVLLIGVGAARILGTYGVFSLTWDERSHLGAGMEWLANGRYTYEAKHVPLSRVFIALGPYLDGNAPKGPAVSSFPLNEEGMWRALAHGDTVIFDHGDAMRNIWLARLGVLPFFVLAGFVVYAWAASTVGVSAALLALALFTTLPPVLAHSGLATTDIAASATLPLAVLAFLRWLPTPTALRSAAFGGATALALLSKLSALLFFPACAAAILVWYIVSERRQGHVLAARLYYPGVTIAFGTACLAVWAAYRFSIGPILPEGAPEYEMLDQALGPGSLPHHLAHALVEVPVPAPEFFRGILQLLQHAAGGQCSYLLGQVGQHWWYFFPVAFLVKTPIPFMFLAPFGGMLMLGRSWHRRDWSFAVPFICAVVLMLVVLPSKINIGIRHILPIYGFLAIAAGYGCVRLHRLIRNRIAGTAVVGALLSWQLASSALAHPDYLAYFNELALLSRNPVVIDSDLDWGQDFFRLSEALRRLQIGQIIVNLHGFQNCVSNGQHDAQHYAFPDTKALPPYQAAPGWIAVSYRPLYVEEGYAWLRDYQPQARIGSSILLYHLTQNDIDRAAIPPDKRNSAPLSDLTFCEF